MITASLLEVNKQAQLAQSQKAPPQAMETPQSVKDKKGVFQPVATPVAQNPLDLQSLLLL